MQILRLDGQFATEPRRQLAGDNAGVLLLQQVAELENRSQDLMQSIRSCLQMTDMIQEIAEVRHCFRIDAGKVLSNQLAATLPLGPSSR